MSFLSLSIPLLQTGPSNKLRDMEEHLAPNVGSGLNPSHWCIVGEFAAQKTYLVVTKHVHFLFDKYTETTISRTNMFKTEIWLRDAPGKIFSPSAPAKWGPMMEIISNKHSKLDFRHVHMDASTSTSLGFSLWANALQIKQQFATSLIILLLEHP